jgi:hypothetical protein
MRNGSGRLITPIFVIALAVAAAACGSSTTTSVLAPTPVPGRCAATVNLSAQTVAADGTVGTLSINTARECQWTVTGLAPWVQLDTVSGQGTADVSYTVAANRSTSPRTLQMIVLDQPVVITQAAAVCTFRVSPSELTVAFSGDTARIRVSAEDFCSWEAKSRVSWIDLTSHDEGRGNGIVDVQISRNTRERRSGTIEVADKNVVVTQREAPAPVPPPPAPAPPPPAPEPAPPPPPEPEPVPVPPPCTYSLSPTEVTLSHNDRRMNISVTTQTTCPVSAKSDVGWMKVKSQPKMGSGTIDVEVDRNGKQRDRTGGIIVSGDNFSQTVTVTQRGDDDDDD